MKRTWVSVALVGALLSAAGCRSSDRRPGGVIVREETVRGEVVYRERIRMPRDAMLRVNLVELRGDRPDRIIAGRMLRTDGRVPIPFELAYDPRRIDENRLYGIDAEILVDRKPWMRCARPERVITRGHPTRGVEVLVRRER